MVVGILGGIGQDEAWLVLAEQVGGLRGTAALPGGQDDPHYRRAQTERRDVQSGQIVANTKGTCELLR